MTLTQNGVAVVETASLHYGIAKKTKPIRVKPLQCILSDQSVLNQFLLDTIEGHQVLKASSMVCIGEAGEAWQQDCAKLHKAYSPTVVSPDGWTTFEPKPEAERECVEVAGTPGQQFAIRAQWGTEVCDETGQHFVQFGEVGDYIFRNADPDHGVNAAGVEDVWIVKRNIFKATYALVNEAPALALE